jgi:hypothetical protein
MEPYYNPYSSRHETPGTIRAKEEREAMLKLQEEGANTKKKEARTAKETARRAEETEKARIDEENRIKKEEDLNLEIQNFNTKHEKDCKFIPSTLNYNDYELTRIDINTMHLEDNKEYYYRNSRIDPKTQDEILEYTKLGKLTNKPHIFVKPSHIQESIPIQVLQFENSDKEDYFYPVEFCKIYSYIPRRKTVINSIHNFTKKISNKITNKISNLGNLGKSIESGGTRKRTRRSKKRARKSNKRSKRSKRTRK